MKLFVGKCAPLNRLASGSTLKVTRVSDFQYPTVFFMKTRVFIFEPLFSSASIVRCAPAGLSYSHIGAAFTPLPSCCTTLSLFRRDREEERKKVEFRDSDSCPTYTHLFSLLWGHTLLLSVLRDFAC